MSYLSQRAEQLENKLCLLLGTPRARPSWSSSYKGWLAANDVPVDPVNWPTPAALDDHHINLFVVHQKRKAAP